MSSGRLKEKYKWYPQSGRRMEYHVAEARATATKALELLETRFQPKRPESMP